MTTPNDDLADLPLAERERLQELEANAVEAPWHACHSEEEPDLWTVAPGLHAEGQSYLVSDLRQEDAELIAEMRNALPRLLAMVAKLEQQVANLRAYDEGTDAAVRQADTRFRQELERREAAEKKLTTLSAERKRMKELTVKLVASLDAAIPHLDSLVLLQAARSGSNIWKDKPKIDIEAAHELLELVRG